MHPFRWAVVILSSIGLVSAFGGPQWCPTILAIADKIVTRLQEHFVPDNGSYTGGTIWTDVNALEDVHNFMLATGSNLFENLSHDSLIGKAVNNGSTNWRAMISNGEAGWVILSLWKMADYNKSRERNFDAYLTAATAVYDFIKLEWDDACGGGLWWDLAHTYKNAVENELFLLVSAMGYLRDPNGPRSSEYWANAQKTWKWLHGSTMRSLDNLWNDGVDKNCNNNNQTTWIYNQGIILSALGAMYAATRDTSYLDEAQKTLDAAIARLTTNRILKESCDDVQPNTTRCNIDQQYFKGVFVKHLQYFLDYANNPKISAKYRDFLYAQYSAIYSYGVNAERDIGSVWYSGDQGGSVFTARTSASGLAALIAAAKYGLCIP